MSISCLSRALFNRATVSLLSSLSVVCSCFSASITLRFAQRICLSSRCSRTFRSLPDAASTSTSTFSASSTVPSRSNKSASSNAVSKSDGDEANFCRSCSNGDTSVDSFGPVPRLSSFSRVFSTLSRAISRSASSWTLFVPASRCQQEIA